jgi:hypothetical protein
MYAKGIIYGDMIRVVTDLSNKDNPLPFEQKLVAHRDHYNSHYGFKDNDIKIPDTIEKLQNNYRPLGDDKSPEGWSTQRFSDLKITFTGEGSNEALEIEGTKYYKAGES